MSNFSNTVTGTYKFDWKMGNFVAFFHAFFDERNDVGHLHSHFKNALNSKLFFK